MSDSLRLYSTVLSALRKASPGEDLRRQKVFAWPLTGLLLEKSIRLPRLATVIVSAAKAASRVRRLRRFLANPRVDVRCYYDGLIRTALAGWAGRTISLAIDTTSLAGRMVICRLAVIYRGRAIPVVWQVYDRASVMRAFNDSKPVLEHGLSRLPAQVRVVLVGDRGFRTTELMAWCQQPGWHFRLRVKSDQLVSLPGGQPQALAQLRLRRGMGRLLHAVLLGTEQYGPIEIAMGRDPSGRTLVHRQRRAGHPADLDRLRPAHGPG